LGPEDLGPEDLGPEDFGPAGLGPEGLGPEADFRGASIGVIWGDSWAGERVIALQQHSKRSVASVAAA
jgi:hypothetical protein